MPSHAFEVLSRSGTEIEVSHKAEGHRYKFTVVKNSQGKRSLAEAVEVTANEGASHRPELFQAGARAFAISEAHRRHAIDSEHFQAKRGSVRGRKMRQDKELEHLRNSEKRENAPGSKLDWEWRFRCCFEPEAPGEGRRACRGKRSLAARSRRSTPRIRWKRNPEGRAASGRGPVSALARGRHDHVAGTFVVTAKIRCGETPSPIEFRPWQIIPKIHCA